MVLLSNAVASLADIFSGMCRLFCEGLVIDLGGRWKRQWGWLVIGKRKNLRLVFLSSSSVTEPEEQFHSLVHLRSDKVKNSQEEECVMKTCLFHQSHLT